MRIGIVQTEGHEQQNKPKTLIVEFIVFYSTWNAYEVIHSANNQMHKLNQAENIVSKFEIQQENIFVNPGLYCSRVTRSNHSTVGDVFKCTCV